MIPALLLALCLPVQAGSKAALRAEVARLEAQVAAQAAQINQLEAQLTTREGQLRDLLQSTRPPSAEQEAAAEVQLTELLALVDSDPGAARLAMEGLQARYPETAAARRAQRVAAELGVIGEPWPGDWQQHVLSWFQGQGRVDPAQDTVVLFFFEEWCPHCRRELPTTGALLAEVDGVQGLALTRVSKTSTDDKVRALLAEHGIDLPVAKEDGALSEALNVSGIPAAAVIRDGHVVWRGHPARLTADVLRSLIE